MLAYLVLFRCSAFILFSDSLIVCCCCFDRDLYPALLRKSDRGKHHNPVAVPTEYGQQEVADAVEGVDLLEAYEKGDIAINSDGECCVLIV